MMDWKATLATVAPVLAAAVGGPLTGTAVGVLAKQLLGNESATELEVSQAIASATPEQLAKLRDIDHQFDIEMKKLGVDVIKIDAEDRGSARALAKARGMAPQITLSIAYNVGYFVILYQFINATASDSIGDWQKGVIGTLIGILTAAIPQINNFWFGSSSGSKEKTAKLAGANPEHARAGLLG